MKEFNKKFGLQNRNGNNPQKGRRGFFVLAILTMLQIGSYGYLVNASVGNVVARMNFEKDTDEIASRVAVLEAKYFTLQNGVTIESVTGMQYTTTARVQYVNERGEPVVMLTRNN